MLKTKDIFIYIFTSDICIICFYWIIYLINDVLKNTFFRKEVWTTFKKTLFNAWRKIWNLIVTLPSIFYWLLIIMNYIQYSCTFSYFLLSDSLSIASASQKIRGEREILGEIMNNGLTTKQKNRDGNNRFFFSVSAFPSSLHQSLMFLKESN